MEKDEEGEPRGCCQTTSVNGAFCILFTGSPANAAKTDRRATGMLESFIPRLQVGVGYHKLRALPTVGRLD